MPLSDVNQVTNNLNTLQLRELPNLSSNSVQQINTLGRAIKHPSMASSTCVLGRQGNQNAAALSPEEGIVKLLERTKYTITQENGQRRYGPPPNWRADPPPRGCEVFIGKIPRDCFEDELIPVFEKIGPIYMFRLMMEFNGSNRGFGFCVYTNKDDTKRAVQELDNYEIRKGKTIGVCYSVDNCRLFVGGIPKCKTRDEILTEMKRVTEGVKDVISYPSVNDKTKNRGFAFVEYESHKAAAMARRKLIPGRIPLWGQQIAVDWAEPEREVNEDIMSKVKILYVRNLMVSTSEESLREHFIRVAGGDPNCVERVKKINDYAFIHFKERDQAAKCLQALNDTTFEGSKIEVTWAKPVDKNEVTARQQSTRASSKLMNELILGKDLAVTNPLNSAATVAASSWLSPLDSTLPFILSSVGQQPLAPDLLSINPAAVGTLGAAMNLSSPSGPRTNGTRTGRRNAAGSRSAGMQRDRKHPIETSRKTAKHSWQLDSFLKQQQRQMNPFICYEILEELARYSDWGVPFYSATPVEMVDSATGGKLQLFTGQVLLPNLQIQYTAPRYYNSPEQAKLGACEVALLNLPYNPMMTNDAFTGNYMVPVASSVGNSATTFLPIPLQNTTPSANNALGLLQTQANGLPMSTPSNLSTQATIALNSSVVLPDCTSNLTMNGYNYSPQLISGSLAATNLFHPYNNPSAYLVDSNAVLMGSNGQLPSVVTLPQTSVNGTNELIHQAAIGQSASLSTPQIPQTGLYQLSVPLHAVQTPTTQLSSVTQNQATLLGLLTQNQTQSVQPSQSNSSCQNGSVSANQTNPVTGAQLPVNGPAAV